MASRPGTKMVSGRENYPMHLTPIDPLHFRIAHLHDPPSGDWLQTFLSTRSLNLAAMDMKLVAVNWNSRFSHSIWVQRLWEEIKQATWFELAASLSHCLGLHLYATNGASSQMWGHLQTGRKVVTYLQEPRKLGNLRDGHDSITAPTAKPDLGFSSMLRECWSVGMPEMWQVMHRYTRQIGRLSHQASDLSHPHNLLPKGCDPCFIWYRV